MKPADTVHLLLLTQQAEQAEAIISAMRSEGIATRGHKVTSSQDFSDSLEEQHWDLACPIAVRRARGSTLKR